MQAERPGSVVNENSKVSNICNSGITKININWLINVGKVIAIHCNDDAVL